MHNYVTKVFLDRDAYFGPYIDQNIGEIYELVLIFAHLHHAGIAIDKMVEELNTLKANASPVSIAPTQNPQANLPQKQENDSKRIDALTRQISELKSALSSEKRAHDKTTLRLEHDLEQLRRESELKINSLKEQNAQLMEFILHLDDDDDDPLEEIEDPHVTETIPEEEFPFALPEKGALFLGGHRNLVKKIEALHPDWLYLSDDNMRTRGAKNIDVIFFWTGHSSHKLQWKVFSDLKDIPPVVYVTATNIEQLEREMLSGYNDLKKK